MLYELSYLISGEIDEAKALDFAKKMENIISDFGKDVAFFEPKKIRLAYPVKKQREGFLASIDFAAEPKNTLQLTKDLAKETEILRFLIVKKLAKKPEEARSQPIPAKPQTEEPKKERVKKEGTTKPAKKEKPTIAEKEKGLKKIEEDLEKILE